MYKCDCKPMVYDISLLPAEYILEVQAEFKDVKARTDVVDSNGRPKNFITMRTIAVPKLDAIKQAIEKGIDVPGARLKHKCER